MFISSDKFFRIVVFNDSIFERIFRMSNLKGKGAWSKEASQNQNKCAYVRIENNEDYLGFMRSCSY